MNTPEHASDAQIDALWALDTQRFHRVKPAAPHFPPTAPPADRLQIAFRQLARAIAARLAS